METLGIYIQIPFCASKCSFCNFSSRVEPARVYDGYVAALCQEIDRLDSIYRSAGIDRSIIDGPVDTAYAGGGTPSLLGIERLRKMWGRLRQCFLLAPQAEFTLELTSGSADRDFLRDLRCMGVNRLSIGAQSFNDAELRSVGRLHSADETREMVRMAREAGFANISLDLIAGLPHQTAESWRASLESALELTPEHISIYLFEIDEKSRLGAEVLRHGDRYRAGFVPDQDFMADAYEYARDTLQRAGYGQYEISNFALPRYESAHNVKYWMLQPYIGLGAGAHSFDGNRRWSNVISAELYRARLQQNESPIEECHAIPKEEQIEEFFFLGLRRRTGVDLAQAESKWGREAIEPWRERVSALAKDGWIERDDDRIWLAGRALLVSNEIFEEFVLA